MVEESAEHHPSDAGHGGLVELVMASATLGYCTLSRDGVVLGHNRTLGELVGSTELRGRSFAELLVPGDRTRASQAISRAAADSRSQPEISVRLRRADATPAHVRISVALITSTTAGDEYVAVILHDDTARHAAASDLASRAHRATALLRALPDAILICSPGGVIVEVNDQAESLFGYTADELIGREIEMLVPSSAAAAHRWKRDRFVATPHARPMITGPDVRGVHKDGHEIPVEVNLAAANLESGPVVVASVRDATQNRTQAAQLRDSLSLVNGVLAAATEQAIFTTNLAGTIETFSRGAEILLGYSASEATGQPASMLDPPDIGQTLMDTWGLRAEDPLPDRIAALVSSQIAMTRPWLLRTKGGDHRHVLLSVTVRRSGDRPDGLILVATDQTERMANEAQLAASEERFRQSFEHSPVGGALISLDPRSLGTFLRVNAALQGALGYTTQEMLEANLADLAHPEDLPLVVSVLDGFAVGEHLSELIEFRFLHADGHAVWAQVSLATVVDSSADSGPYAVATIADITARRIAEAELTHNALHDTLTGLPNRALITEQLTQALLRARRSHAGVGVLYIDLDNFKDVNDSLGHTAGDELLVEISRRLSTSIRDSDTAGRLGGDEFVVVCEDLDTGTDITTLADRITAALAIQLPIAGRMIAVSASIGIAHTTDPDVTPEDLLREADIAMYQAKGNGRARYEFSDPELQVRALRQIELEADLRATLAVHARTGPANAPTSQLLRQPQQGRLFLVYQPCFAARTGKLVACEALLRWDHPARGILTPGQFLDVAEDRALIRPLGAWVLHEAATQGARWQAQFGDLAPEVWVNVSAGQMGRNHFADQVADVLAETGLAPEKLWIELTERQALSSAHSVLDDLHALPALGVRLAIDDFGTGYAGLDLLRRLPVSALKVDASYVAALGADPSGNALVATVVNLGHALDLTVIAEGVETVEQQAAVTELGADILQGYLLARPGPPQQVLDILGTQHVRGV